MGSKDWAAAVVGLASLASAGCSVFGISDVEQPRYQVVLSEGDREVRRYEGYLVAKTTVEGPFRRAQGEAFRILAGYIFGANEARREFAMTAPVTQAPAPAGERMAMTAPVTQTPEGDAWTMAFMMPSEYTLDTLPTPSDPRVRFESVPPKLVGAIRYAWGAGEERNRAKARELIDWLADGGDYIPVSAPRFAGYNPPWTLPFLRRNEMLVDLEPAAGRSTVP